jgi:hypothetical protein
MRWPRQHLPILALIAVNLALGAVLAPHYGQNTDELAEASYGEASLQSYLAPREGFRGPLLEAKGPFYFMIWVSAAAILDEVVPGWSVVDARHFVNFLVFQGAIVAVYLLSLRKARPSVAFAAALLFESQPLLFGHAFVNQKDSTFMAFFAVAIVMGLSGVDRFVRQKGSDRPPSAKPQRLTFDGMKGWPQAFWSGVHFPSGQRTAIVAALACGILIGRALLDDPLRVWIARALNAIYSGTSWPPLNRLFLRLAENAATVPVSDYVTKAIGMLDLMVAWTSVGLLVLALWMSRSTWGPTARRFSREVLGFAGPAAFLLGMTVAIRTAGLFGGLMVAGYAWHQGRRRSVPFLLAYGVVGGIVAFALWPQLWGGPLEFLRASVESSLQFPDEHEVLFRGQLLLSSGLPRTFLPWLTASQFTLPAVLLLILALPLNMWIASRPARSEIFLWIVLSWFLLPFIAVIAFRLPIYNNFRHLLFLVPPLFVLGAVALERFLQVRGRFAWLVPALTVTMLVPGVVGIVRLHPYEYIYYNELVGGVRGAYGAYELDYWCTSYREAARAVNAIAPAGSTIAVWGPVSAASPFLRPDLTPQHLPSSQVQTPTPGSLAMGCSWATIADDFLPSYETAWTVEREGVSLALVKRPSATRPLGESMEATEGDAFGHRASEDLSVDPP